MPVRIILEKKCSTRMSFLHTGRTDMHTNTTDALTQLRIVVCVITQAMTPQKMPS